mmetsp:Transcript_34571/g.97494  ORF Transcript_34571/g.97494 Transcript_34571/m.97494 type:complete len:352 (-) Transcript_34571:278-1333(-)|eukprot:CAMPEP_0119149028 /NCGR_PEP_ID=MMETSP1310-20130426/42758_1 /TAXON_ID=464262 /ORGANISM="Genus nov. species nov., Strain RCC2339" /LENGTH=351 /DNA_ID=CAMNT_0007141105 /DNA_START=71 /DNA_END=1126 /DNA_ORIENTATION=-
MPGRRGPMPKRKVVVRNLPYDLKEEDFLEAVKEWVENNTDYFVYFPGSKTVNSYTNSLAFMNFRKTDHVLAFKAGFDGHAFPTGKRRELKCQIEYAPYQRAPRGKKKTDSLRGTIETDAAYLKWKEEHEAPVEPLPSVDEQLKKLTEAEEEKGVVETPLMIHMKNKYKMKEARAVRAAAAKGDRSRQGKKQKGRGAPSSDKKSGGTDSQRGGRRNTRRSGKKTTSQGGKARGGADNAAPVTPVKVKQRPPDQRTGGKERNSSEKVSGGGDAVERSGSGRNPTSQRRDAGGRGGDAAAGGKQADFRRGERGGKVNDLKKGAAPGGGGRGRGRGGKSRRGNYKGKPSSNPPTE